MHLDSVIAVSLSFHLPFRARDLQSVPHPRALRVDGSPFAEGEACREPRFSRSRPSCS